MSPLNPRFEKILRRYLGLLDADEPIPPDDPLTDLGLDSLTTIELVLDLEEEYRVMFPDDLLGPDLFRAAINLQEAVERLSESADVDIGVMR